ncbi:MAG: serine/threonine-protein phosphatase [Magnetococcales bacterium]|nr:serine/threonine-protein phosphatase [Magnetococcales bacterium]
MSSFRPDGAQHVLLGDFTGHGLSAAIGGPLVSDIFYAMTRKGLPPNEIMAEINERLHEKTPTEMFMAACLLELDPSRTRLTVWNCTIPDVLVYRNSELFMRIPSVSLPMGVVRQYDVPGFSLNVQPSDRVYVYSDGFIEEHNATDVMFGQTNLEQSVARMLQMDEPLQVIQTMLMEYRSGHEQTDDMTMVEVVC